MTDKPCDRVKECPKCGYKGSWILKWLADMGGKSTTLMARCHECGFEEAWETADAIPAPPKTSKCALLSAELLDFAKELHRQELAGDLAVQSVSEAYGFGENALTARWEWRTGRESRGK